MISNGEYIRVKTNGEIEMSWRCSSTTNEGLVNNLWKHGLLNTPRVREAMVGVDRAQFSSEMPYHDSPQRIGYDATISGECCFTCFFLGRGVGSGKWEFVRGEG